MAIKFFKENIADGNNLLQAQYTLDRCRSGQHASTVSPAYTLDCCTCLDCRPSLHASTISPAYTLDRCRSGLHALTINPAYTLDRCRSGLHVVAIESFQKTLPTSACPAYTRQGPAVMTWHVTRSLDSAYSLIRFFRNATSLCSGPQAQLT